MTERKISPLKGLYRKTTSGSGGNSNWRASSHTTEMRCDPTFAAFAAAIFERRGENSTPIISRKSYSSASRRARPFAATDIDKSEAGEIFLDVRERGSEHVGIDGLVILGVGAQPAAMHHTRGIAAGQLSRRDASRDRTPPEGARRVPQGHGFARLRTPVPRRSPGMLGTGATLPCMASSMVMLFTSSVRPMD